MLIRWIESGGKSLPSANDDSDDGRDTEGRRREDLYANNCLIRNDVAQTRARRIQRKRRRQEKEGKEEKTDIKQRKGRKQTPSLFMIQIICEAIESKRQTDQRRTGERRDSRCGIGPGDDVRSCNGVRFIGIITGNDEVDRQRERERSR